jgi:hypothetical protein
MDRNLKVAAAVAAILSAGAAHAQTAIDPTSAQNGTPLYIAGSSAAKNAILTVLETGVNGTTPVFCAGSAGYSVFSSTPDPNFYAVSCAPVAATGLSGANGSNVFTVWYRAEGGSVTGVLPMISGSSINQLTLNTNYAQTSSGYTVTVVGNATGNGLDDSFGNVFKAPVQLGITDVEPGALVKNNYPSAYSTSAYGKASSTQLTNYGTNNGQVIFDQVFGIFVNTKGTGFTEAEQAGNGQAVVTGTASGLALSAQTIATILQGEVTDWDAVPLADGSTNTVTGQTSSPITLIDREQGSGSRTATDIFFTQDHCSSNSANGAINAAGNAYGTEYFSTLDVLTAANTTPGAITYATIDQAGTNFPNLTLVAINGVQPSNLAAATGQYGDWFEAYAITNPSLTGVQATLAGNLVAAFENISKLGFGQADLLANPLYSSVKPAFPVTNTVGSVTGGKAIYTNPYQRGGNSCQDPSASIKSR